MEDIINGKNHWEIKSFNYWTHQLSKDESGLVWINVGWHLPLSVEKGMLNRVLSVSADTYSIKFN